MKVTIEIFYGDAESIKNGISLLNSMCPTDCGVSTDAVVSPLPSVSEKSIAAPVFVPTPPVPEVRTQELDTAGVQWDARIHSSSRATLAKNGQWKTKRGVDPKLIESVMAEITPTQAGPTTPPPPAPPIAKGAYIKSQRKPTPPPAPPVAPAKLPAATPPPVSDIDPDFLAFMQSAIEGGKTAEECDAAAVSLGLTGGMAAVQFNTDKIPQMKLLLGLTGE